MKMEKSGKAMTILSLLLLPASGISHGYGGVAPDSLVNTLSEAERKAGWILLYDGKTMDRWTGFKQSTVPSYWHTDDQAISNTLNRTDFLCTRAEYGNFEFAADWRISPTGKSGIFGRSSAASKAPYELSIEYVIVDDTTLRDDQRTHVAGGTHGIFCPTFDAQPRDRSDTSSACIRSARPPGQYNSSAMVYDGNIIEHWMNGRKILQFELFSPIYMRNRNNWAQNPDFGKQAKGALCLQNEVPKIDRPSTLWFRNLKVRPFTPGEKLAGPLILPQAGNHPAGTLVTLEAAIRGARIHYTTDGSVPTAQSAVYNQPIPIQGGMTVKAITVRDRFQNSDVESVEYRSVGTRLEARARRSGGLDRVFSIPGSDVIRFRLRDRGAYAVAVAAPSGQVLGRYRLEGGGERVIRRPSAWQPGLYLVSLSSAGGSEASILALP